MSNAPMVTIMPESNNSSAVVWIMAMPPRMTGDTWRILANRGGRAIVQTPGSGGECHLSDEGFDACIVRIEGQFVEASALAVIIESAIKAAI